MKLAKRKAKEAPIILGANDEHVEKIIHHDVAAGRRQWLMVALPLSLLVAVGAVVMYARAAVNQQSFIASSDTYVKEKEPTTNSSERDQMVVSGKTGFKKSSYIRFSVKGLGAKKVEKSTLRIYVLNTPSSKPGDIYLIPSATNAPALKDMTWNTQPSLDGAVRVGTIGAVAANTWYDIPLSTTSWPDGSYLLALVGTSDADVRFASRESANKPQLDITLASTPPPPAPPTVSLTATSSTVEVGSKISLTWAATNAPSSCTASGSWSGTKAASGNETTAALTAIQAYTYTLSCTNAGGSGQASTTVTTKARPGGAVPTPVTGAFFGTHGDSGYSGGRLAHTTFREGQIGRKFDHQRIFFSGDAWKTANLSTHAEMQAAKTDGRIPMVSFKVGGSAASWKVIASGSEDANIAKLADQVKAYGSPVWMTLHHEPDEEACEVNNSSSCGTAAEYRAMWIRFHDIFKQKGVTNVSWNWITMSYSFGVGGTRAETIKQMYPGAQYVDWIMADPYNFIATSGNGVCPSWRNDANASAKWDSTWKSLGSHMQAWYDWSAQQGKPLGIAEWGVLDDPRSGKESRKAAWITEAQNDLKAKYPLIRAMTYFDFVIPAEGCDWRITEGSASTASANAAIAAYKAMAQDSYFNPNKR